MGRKISPLFKILGISKSFYEFDKKVEKLGWSSGCKWLLNELKINYKFEIGSFPKKGAVIIHANHPTGLDPYLLTAAIGRDDSYFWGDLYQLKKGKSISRNIIGMAPKPFWTIIRRPITNWPGYIYMRLSTPTLGKKQTKKININSIEKTVRLLKQKKQIIIFPSGGEYEFLKPHRGLEVLLKKCKDQNIDLKLIKVKIKNFSELRLFFHFLFKTKINVSILKSR